MQQRVVHYYSEGSKVEADYYLPDGAGNDARLPAIILCHGYSGLRRLILPDFARAFVGAGYAALAFDYRGFGGSAGSKWRVLPQEQVQDIRNSVTWLENQPEVDPARIGIWGTSNGGAHVVAAAGCDDRIRCAVGQVGFGDGRRLVMGRYMPDESKAFLQLLKEQRRKRVLTGKGDAVPVGQLLNSAETTTMSAETMKYIPEVYCEIEWESAEATLEYRPIDVADKIAPRALMLIAGEHDTLCPFDDYRAVYERAGEPKRWICYPIGHYDIYKPEWIERTGRDALDWFNKYLNGA
jgi:dipeptidyl aminopeptidase/acylaminoacyl peptidase